MALSLEAKAEIIDKYKTHDGDTGSPEVQIALLTARIKYLTEHLKENKLDHASRRGLLKLVSQRRNLQRYLSGVDKGRYDKLIKSLGLRK